MDYLRLSAYRLLAQFELMLRGFSTLKIINLFCCARTLQPDGILRYWNRDGYIPQHKLIIVSWYTLMTWYQIGQVRTAKYRSYKYSQTIRIAQITIRCNWLYFHSSWTMLYVFIHYGAAACLCPTRTYL